MTKENPAKKSKPKVNTFSIIVFPDGETYSGIEGCRIMDITEEQLEQIESGECKPSELDSYTYKKLETILGILRI